MSILNKIYCPHQCSAILYLIDGGHRTERKNRSGMFIFSCLGYSASVVEFSVLDLNLNHCFLNSHIFGLGLSLTTSFSEYC